MDAFPVSFSGKDLKSAGIVYLVRALEIYIHLYIF